jgi:hypothetical protein
MNPVTSVINIFEAFFNDPTAIAVMIFCLVIILNGLFTYKIHSQHSLVAKNRPPETFWFSVEHLAALSWLLSCIFGVTAGLILLNQALDTILNSVMTWKALIAIAVMASGFPGSVEKVVGLPRDHAHFR